MTKGFVTIATGKEHYYKLALNLLRSYKECSKSNYKFAIIADSENDYTKEFDDVVILKNAKKSWMDKIELLKMCPYDETIFIDADCLIYNDINFFWELFSKTDDFSCFGETLPLNSTEGWFTSDVKDIYPIKFITHLHGMLYFIRKGKKIDEMYKLCNEIIDNYDNLTFRAFNDILADEPVFALAMAILDLKPIKRKSNYYCFVPFATKVKTNFNTKKVIFENEKDGVVNSCYVVHWGNKNTFLPQYKKDAYALNYYYENSKTLLKKIFRFFMVDLNIYHICLSFNYYLIKIIKINMWLIERIICKIRKLF